MYNHVSIWTYKHTQGEHASLQELQFHFTVQQHASEVNWKYNITYKLGFYIKLNLWSEIHIKTH